MEINQEKTEPTRLTPALQFVLKYHTAIKCSLIHKTEGPRKAIKIGLLLAPLREHWPYIVPYMGVHRADFHCLSGLFRVILIKTAMEKIITV